MRLSKGGGQGNCVGGRWNSPGRGTGCWGGWFGCWNGRVGSWGGWLRYRCSKVVVLRPLESNGNSFSSDGRTDSWPGSLIFSLSFDVASSAPMSEDKWDLRQEKIS